MPATSSEQNLTHPKILGLIDSSSQDTHSTGRVVDEHEVSEDCLTISILRPAGLDRGAALPSMVFLHGGGFLCERLGSRYILYLI